MSIIEQIVEWLKEKVRSAHAEGIVLGLSGGLDSAVTGALCVRAFPKATLGLIMPCLSDREDIVDADLVASSFSIPKKIIDLRPVFECFLTSLKTVFQNDNNAVQIKEEKIVIGNLKARLRMCTLYYFANALNYLVVGTGNKSELMMGYFTKYGDGGVDLLPLGNFTKTQIYQLAAELKVPEKIIEKVPSAGLWSGQRDEDELGIKYVDLDKILVALETDKFAPGLDKTLLEKVKGTIEMTEHKRKTPAIFSISCLRG